MPFGGWPTRWLMTDERMGDRLFTAIRRLPRGSGVVFRHDHLPPVSRERLARAVARACRRRSLVLAVARDVGLARRVGAELVHQPTSAAGLMPVSHSAHDETEAKAARRCGAVVVFVSPVFPTRSHPDRVALGSAEAARLARLCGGFAVALGGMDQRRFAAIRTHGFDGYAGIDCWLE